MAPLPGTQVYEIGELHTIFYLCFLVLLVYLSVFTFVSLIKNTKIVCLVTCLPPMPKFFETRSYWHGGFTEDQQKWYKEHRLSQEAIHLWKQIHQLYEYARNLCSKYHISFCRDEACCFMRHKHLAFQCEYNHDETLASYAKGN